jgi:hypothetical protein
MPFDAIVTTWIASLSSLRATINQYLKTFPLKRRMQKVSVLPLNEGGKSQGRPSLPQREVSTKKQAKKSQRLLDLAIRNISQQGTLLSREIFQYDLPLPVSLSSYVQLNEPFAHYDDKA